MCVTLQWYYNIEFFFRCTIITSLVQFGYELWNKLSSQKYYKTTTEMLFTNRILHIYNIISKNNPTIYNKNKNKFIALQMNSGAWKYFI